MWLFSEIIIKAFDIKNKNNGKLSHITLNTKIMFQIPNQCFLNQN